MFDRGFDPGTLFGDRLGELDERREATSPCPGQPRVEQLDGFVVADAVDLPELLGDQVGAVQRLVGLLDVGELLALAPGEPVGVLSQHEARALELLRYLLLAGAAGVVPHLPADLIERVGSELYDMKWVYAPDRVRAPLADR